MTLTDIDRFLKLCTKADHPGTPPEEAALSRKMAAQMEVTHPGIRAKAKLVQQVVDAEGAPEGASPTNTGARNAGVPPATNWGSWAASILQQAVQQGVNAVVDDVSGAGRLAALKKGDVVLRPHPCAEDQVCLEIRARKADVNRSRTRAEILDSIEDALLQQTE